MIVPRNMLNPTLQPVVFGRLSEFATLFCAILYHWDLLHHCMMCT